MSVKYIPMSTPDISSIRRDMLVRIDDDTKDDSLLDPKPEEHTHPVSNDEQNEQLLNTDIPADPTGSDITKAALQEAGYNPDFSSPSPVAPVEHDQTNLQDDPGMGSLLGKDDPSQDTVMKSSVAPFEIPTEMMPVTESPVKYASDCEEYFTEAAMKAKVRNKLPDSEFGIPRLRKYPLNDEKHVRMAISMFSHCKDPKDKALLAKKIFAKVEELKMDVKIGKNTELYEYAPKSLQETSILPVLNEEETEVQVYGMNKSMDSRTKKEIAEEHISRNLLFYNNLFYNPDLAKSIKAISKYTFFDYFYPSFKTHNFYSRLKTALGGIATDADIYQKFGMQYPLATTYGPGENWPSIADEEQFWILVDGTAQEDSAWFHVNTADDHDHVKYCLTLYSIMREIVNDPCFDMDQLSPRHIGVLTDWSQQVIYNWDLMNVEEPMSEQYLYYAQKLHDLFWDCTDNPLDPTCAASNIISVVRQMAAARDLVGNMNEGTELISKEACAGYMVHELGFEDDLFLLPDTLEYPIFDRGSVRLAMDMITQVPKENIQTYTKNLNRKYKELGCTFSISIDHPYAKYADQNIIDHMNRILIEGDTVVSDQGTSAGSEPMDTEPWYKRLDINGNVPRNLMDNKELGPNDKKYPNPDFSRYSSVF